MKENDSARRAAGEVIPPQTRRRLRRRWPGVSAGRRQGTAVGPPLGGLTERRIGCLLSFYCW
jgi:hypothetical protein